jgi:hypothetical protein
MTDAVRAMLLMASVFAMACGGAPPDVVEQRQDEPVRDRSSTYSVPVEAAPSPCGWIELPRGALEYVPCPTEGAPSPISDPPGEDEGYGAVPGTFDPRPEPPGDPPPM